MRRRRPEGTLERMLRAYQEHRSGTDESFQDFSRRYSIDGLLALFEQQAVTA